MRCRWARCSCVWGRVAARLPWWAYVVFVCCGVVLANGRSRRARCSDVGIIPWTVTVWYWLCICREFVVVSSSLTDGCSYGRQQTLLSKSGSCMEGRWKAGAQG